MRVLFISLISFCSLLVSAQDTLYVYAKSGLVMRDNGSTNGKKLRAIPFGAAVVLTGVYSDSVEVPVLASVEQYDAEGADEVPMSLPYTMKEPYREVEYEGQKGFVYGGYLCRYSPEMKDEAVSITAAWLGARPGTLDTLVDGRNKESELRLLLHAGNDICYRQGYVDGGTSETIILPGGTLAEGYLIANRLYQLDEGPKWMTIPSEEMDDVPELLVQADDYSLTFSNYNGVVRITVVNGLLIIYQDWSC
jgi:hypothetical protein